jgi:4-hydroxybenzoate polyprenyltransferase
MSSQPLVASPTEDVAVPLCVDLDGTLVASDTLFESLLAVARTQPLALLKLPLWLRRGKAAVKHELAARALPAIELLPYRQALLTHLAAERARGRRLVLATGADARIAEAVAEHTHLFDEVLASDGRINLSGARKAAALATAFEHFDYIGDSTADRPVWRRARQALVVGSPRLARDVAGARAIAPRERSLRTVAKAIRVHQWVKNLLVFVPALAAHSLWRGAMLRATLLAFVGFCLCASAGYLLNDMLDLDADRRDPKKRHRPLASGALPIAAALPLVPALLAAGAWLGFVASPMVALLLCFHFVTTTWYSWSGKRVAILDVMVLAGLYTLRIFTGAAACHVPVSPWLLGVSLFMFTSLALVKRVSELGRLRARGGSSAPGRGYQIDDWTVMLMLGGASGYMTVVILALYVHSPDVTMLYRYPDRLWALCPLALFWVSRLWLLTSRGEVDADPVAFALKDRASRIIGVLGLAAAWAAS